MRPDGEEADVFARASAAWQEGRHEAAADLLEALLERRPKDLDALNTLAMMALNLGEAGRAIGYLERAAAVAPGAAPIWFNLFQACDLAGDTVTEGLSRIFGSIYNGDPAPLQSLVENDDANEYVRSAAIDAFLEELRVGRRSSDNTLDAYARDLTDYARFARGHGLASWREATVTFADAYFAHLGEQRLSAATVARSSSVSIDSLTRSATAIGPHRSSRH